MQFSVLSDNLQQALAYLKPSIPAKPALPVLACVRLETNGQRLFLSASDLSQTLTVWVGGKVDEDGSACINYKDMVGSLPTEKMLSRGKKTVKVINRVDFNLESDPKDRVVLKMGATTRKLPYLPSDEYPFVKRIDTELSSKAIKWNIPATTLKEAIKHCVVSMASDDSRPVLTTLYTIISEQHVEFVSADGYRLTRTRYDGVRMENRYGGQELVDDPSLRLCIPGKTVTLLSHLLAKSDDYDSLTFYLHEGEMWIEHKRWELHISANQDVPLAEQARFPDYLGLIESSIPQYPYDLTAPYTYPHVEMYACDLLNALNTIKSVASESANASKWTWRFTDSGLSSLKVSSTNSEKGEAEFLVDCSVTGTPGDVVSLNYAYVMDVVKLFSLETNLVFAVKDDKSPVVIWEATKPHITHVLMPMSMGR